MLAGAIPTIFSPDPRNTVMMEGRGRISVTTTRFTSLGYFHLAARMVCYITVPPDWDASGSPASLPGFCLSFGSFPPAAGRCLQPGLTQPVFLMPRPGSLLIRRPQGTPLKMIAVNFFIILFLSLQPFIFTLCITCIYTCLPLNRIIRSAHKGTS